MVVNPLTDQDVLSVLLAVDVLTLLEKEESVANSQSEDAWLSDTSVLENALDVKVTVVLTLVAPKDGEVIVGAFDTDATLVVN